MKGFLSVEEADCAGKRVLVRADLNVPLTAGRVADDTRLRESLPTLQLLARKGARVIVCSHLGRPGGKRDLTQSLRPVADRLGQLLGMPVAFAEDCVGPAAERAVERLKPGQILVLENLRFRKEEEENHPEFAAALAGLADLYVNDAFGTAHRAHASTEGIASHLPAYAGLLLTKELDLLGRALNNPERPFVAVLGGSKVSSKIDVLKNLLGRVDTVCIGGAMAFTFSQALGGRIGDSLVEPDKVAHARKILDDAKARGVEFLLPLDIVVTQNLKGEGPTRVVPFGEVPDGWKGVDIGPKTVARFGEAVVRARTVLVNGPLGVFEVPEFLAGTRGVLQAVADCDGTTIVGGGDSAAAIHACGLAGRVTHVSTGGGASLEFLEGRTLPGVAALRRFAQSVAH